MAGYEEVIVGDARLILGDCREVLPTLTKVDAVITDPPYGMSFRSGYRQIQHHKIINDHDISCLRWACSIPVEHSLYVFCRWDNIRDCPPSKSCITWVKNNWSMGDLRHSHGRQTELALFWPGTRHFWVGCRPSDVVFSSKTGNEEHPTEKPIYLMEQFIRWTSGLVVDPFMGSGTTGVACMNLGRKFIGIEIERRYFDIACERISRAQAQGKLLPHDIAPAVALDCQGGMF